MYKATQRTCALHLDEPFSHCRLIGMPIQARRHGSPMTFQMWHSGEQNQDLVEGRRLRANNHDIDRELVEDYRNNGSWCGQKQPQRRSVRYTLLCAEGGSPRASAARKVVDRPSPTMASKINPPKRSQFSATTREHLDFRWNHGRNLSRRCC